MTDVIDQTVRQVGRALPGPGLLHRRSVLQEIEDGLRDAQAAHVDAGCAEPDAAQRAVEDFGDPALVGEQLGTWCAARLVRRLAAAQAVVVVLSVVGWASLGATTDTEQLQTGNVQTLPWLHLAFLAVSVPAVLTGLLAHHRLARVRVSGAGIRRWALVTAGAGVGAVLGTVATSAFKQAVVREPNVAGEVVLTVVTRSIGLALLAGACGVVLAVWNLGRRRAPIEPGSAR